MNPPGWSAGSVGEDSQASSERPAGQVHPPRTPSTGLRVALLVVSALTAWLGYAIAGPVAALVVGVSAGLLSAVAIECLRVVPTFFARHPRLRLSMMIALRLLILTGSAYSYFHPALHGADRPHEPAGTGALQRFMNFLTALLHDAAPAVAQPSVLRILLLAVMAFVLLSMLRLIVRSWSR